MKRTKDINVINRKAKFDYHLLRSEIAGIQLKGSEVKSIRHGLAGLTDTYCIFENGELYVRGLHIPVMKNSSSAHEPDCNRKLLLKKQEIKKLQKDLIKGHSIVPYKIFQNEKGLFKMEIFLAKGKKEYDKRETIKSRDVSRDIARNE